MKKKEYMTPTMDVVEIKNMTLLAGSGVTSVDPDIDFGGIDEGGTLDPAAPPGLLPNMGLPSFVFE